MKILVLDDHDLSWKIRKDQFEEAGRSLEIVRPSDFTENTEINLTAYDVLIVHNSLEGGKKLDKELTKKHGRGKVVVGNKPITTIVINNLFQDLSQTTEKWRATKDFLKITEVSSLTEIEDSLDNLQKIRRLKDSQNDDIKLATSLVNSLPVAARVLDAKRETVLAVNKKWKWSPQSPDKVILGDFDFDPELFDPKSDPNPHSFWQIVQSKLEGGKHLQIAQEKFYNSTPDLQKQVSLIWNQMFSFGFNCMRFYRLLPAPESTGVLSLESAYRNTGDHRLVNSDKVIISKRRIEALRKKYKCPLWFRGQNGHFSFPISARFGQNIDSLETDLRANKNRQKLVFAKNIFLTDEPDTLDMSISNLLDELLKIDSPSETICLPIFSRNYIHSDGKKGQILGILFLDAVTLEDRKKALDNLRRKSTRVLHDVKIAAEYLENERSKLIQDATEDAKAFMLQNLPDRFSADAKQDFIKKLLEKAMELSGCSAASIAWKSNGNSNLQEPLKTPTPPPRVERVVFDSKVYPPNGEHARLFEMAKNRKASDLAVPALKKCLESGESVFFHHGPPTPLKEDLNLGKPRFAVPLKIGVDPNARGAIGLTVNHSNHLFLQSDVDRLMPLIELCSGTIHYLDHINYSNRREKKIFHEVKRHCRHIRRSIRSKSYASAATRIDLLSSFSSKYERGLPLPEEFDLLEIVKTEQTNFQLLHHHWHFENQVNGDEFIIYHGIREIAENAIRALYANIEDYGLHKNHEKYVVQTRFDANDDNVKIRIASITSNPENEWPYFRELGRDLFQTMNGIESQGGTFEFSVQTFDECRQGISEIIWPKDKSEIK